MLLSKHFLETGNKYTYVHVHVHVHVRKQLICLTNSVIKFTHTNSLYALWYMYVICLFCTVTYMCTSYKGNMSIISLPGELEINY